MITYVIMLLLFAFLTYTLLKGARVTNNSNHFFDKVNTNALRGFWCLIVILVHIPIQYQNKIQDMLGSFAYIGVTFFFMTSAYGLKLSVMGNSESIKKFWMRRLPRLIIPCLIVNLISVICSLLSGNGFRIRNLITINGWVIWLLVCYLIFWVCNIIFEKHQDAIICLLVIMFSVVMYVCDGWINSTTWCPEVFGFVWGILLFRFKERFIEWMNKRWFAKSFMICMVAGVAGLCYLKFKTVMLFGDYLLKILLGVLIITFMLAVNIHISIGNSVSKFIGSISYEIYLLHGTVFRFVMFFVPKLDSGVFIVVSIVITVLLSVVANKFSNVLLRLGKKNENLNDKQIFI